MADLIMYFFIFLALIIIAYRLGKQDGRQEIQNEAVEKGLAYFNTMTNEKGWKE